MTWVGVSPMLCPACRWVGSQPVVPASISTSRLLPASSYSLLRNVLSVYMTLSGCPCTVVRSPGRSRYSKTRTRSFSNTTLYLSGSVQVGSASIGTSRAANLVESDSIEWYSGGDDSSRQGQDGG